MPADSGAGSPSAGRSLWGDRELWELTPEPQIPRKNPQCPLLPGKYAFNTFAGKVTIVPTTNFILKWNRGEVGTHRFDENLAEVSLITKDAFELSLPLSVVVHIDYRKAAPRSRPPSTPKPRP